MKYFLLLFFVFQTINAKDPEGTKGCFTGGKLHLVPSGMQRTVSPDKSVLVNFEYESDEISYYDFKTQSTKTFSKPLNSMVFIRDDGKLVFTAFDSISESDSPQVVFKKLQKLNTNLLDPKTGKTSTIKGKFILYEDATIYDPISVKGNNIFFKTDKNETRSLDLTKDTENNFTKNIKFKYSYTWDKRKKKIIFKHLGKELFTSDFDIQGEDWLPTVMTPDNKKILIREPPTVEHPDKLKFSIVDLEKKSLKNYITPKGFQLGFDEEENNVSPDSKYLILEPQGADGVFGILDTENAKIKKFKNLQGLNARFDDAGNVCATHGNNWKCVNPHTDKVVKDLYLPTVDGFDVTELGKSGYLISSYLGGEEGIQNYVMTDGQFCAKNLPSVSCDCYDLRTPKTTQRLEFSKDVALIAACAKNYDKNDWKNLTPELSELDEKSSLMLLKRFSKPGGFNPKTDLSYLTAMIDAGISNIYPKQFSAAMTGVLYSSDRLFDSLMEYGDKHRKELSGPADQSCLTVEEKKLLSNRVYQYSKSRIYTNRKPKFDELRKSLSPAVSYLSVRQKEIIAGLAANRLVETAGDNYRLRDIFPSKIYKFSENAVKKELGLKYNNLTDLTVTRDGENVRLHLLGLNSIPGGTYGDTGFWIKEASSYKVDSLKDADNTITQKWNYDGTEYSASINLNKKSFDKKIISTAPSPDYNGLWSDNKLNGVVIAGTNLGPGLTEKTMKQYIEYYAKDGFKFGAPEQNSDIVGYLKSKVSGTDPMDYFVKEAHSDGDEKNLFRVSNEGSILRGTRVRNGKSETIDLIYPSVKGKSTLLSNSLFGNWIREREKNGQSELLYLNSSCWSKSKAVYEISAAGSSTLVNIPTTTSMTVFSNRTDNVMRAAIDGFRNQKSYKDIRIDMEQNSKYSSGQSNVFIFPDEDAYKSQITDVVKVPIEIETHIYKQDASGKMAPYSIEGH